MNKDADSQSLLKVYFYIALMMFISLAVLRIFNSVNYLLDTYEHIHASWLVSTGLVPYRDFFEHHHPLLWYLFAPVTQLFYRDVNIIYVARFVAVIGYISVLYLLYILAKLYSRSKTGAYLSILFILSVTSLWMDVQNLRPDIFMYISILVALISFFCYIDKRQVKYLCLSYTLWLMAFLFLQKTIFLSIGFILYNFVLLYKKDIIVSDFIKALIFPIGLSLYLLFLLYNTDTIKDWYQYNFTFNLILKNNFGSHSSGLSPYISYVALFVAMFIIRIYHFSLKGNILFIVWLFANLSLLIFAPHPQYYFFSFVLSAILLSPYFKKLYAKKNFAIMVVATIFLTHTFYALLNATSTSRSMNKEQKLIEYILNNTTNEEKLLSGHYAYNLFNPDTNYYWLEFYTIAILADLYTDKHVDYNEQIKKYRPKFLFLPLADFDRIAYSNSTWMRKRNTALLKRASQGDKNAKNKLSNLNIDYWQIDMDYVKENYKYIGSYGAANLWERIDI